MGVAMLRDALASIDGFDEEATIYAREPWGPTSAAVIAIEGEESATKAISEGFTYLLEVSLAKDVIDVWSAWRSGDVPSADQRCEAVVYYAMNDAYLPPQGQG